MRAAAGGLIVFVLLVSAPVRTSAWGFEAHRFIMDRAISLLPAELKPLFEANRAMLVERSVDPDTWRTAGFEQEPPNHFVDLDWEGFGKYPFDGLPRDYAKAVEKFGKDGVDAKGTLPWRTEEFYGNLRRAFIDYPTNPYGPFQLLFFAASLTHYTSDAHQPFHATYNYNGQLTGQTGIHARWEATVFERFHDQMTIAPKPIPPIRNPRDFIFERLLEGTRLVPVVLKADRDAIGTGELYDDAYYKAFFAGTQSVMERRLSESIAASAAMIAGAWEAAGKPPAPIKVTLPPQRRQPAR